MSGNLLGETMKDINRLVVKSKRVVTAQMENGYVYYSPDQLHGICIKNNINDMLAECEIGKPYGTI